MRFVLNFLAEEYESGSAYSTLNILRSSLSSLLLPCEGHAVGSHPLVSRFMKGVFNLRPPQPRYNCTWDVKVVLDYLRTLVPNDSISFENLTLKLVMLIALISGRRSHTIAHIITQDSTVSNSSVSFYIKQLIKTSKPGRPAPVIQLPAYPEDERICVLQTLREYLKKTSHCRHSSRYLFVSINRPHRNVSSQTVSRWLKKVLHLAGIDTSMFKGHSTRAASTSAAFRSGTAIDTILATAGWSSVRTFALFYNKPLNLTKNSFEIASLQ